MAKKQKRQVSRSASPVVKERPEVYPERTAAPSVPAATRYPVSSSRTSATASTEFNPDYSYVVKDLKRIGILAGSFITILIVLSIFLR